MSRPRLPVRPLLSLALTLPGALSAASGPADLGGFVEAHCARCHDDVERKGDLDLTALAVDPARPAAFDLWVRVHDRVAAGEMPPRDQARPPAAEQAAFLEGLAGRLVAADREKRGGEGRSTRRRLNRHEYEHAVRDLLGAPWLQVKEWLPEDGEAHRFNKSGEALDVSHVQLARYLAAAEYALREVIAPSVEPPAAGVTRHYARDQRSFTGPMKFSVFNTAPERATFPVLGLAAQPEVRAGRAPVTVGPADPAARDLEGVGLVASTYEPLEPKFIQFKAPASGRYRLRFQGFSVWVGPAKPVPNRPDRWFIPDFDDVQPGRRSEPVTVYAETPPRQLRRLGAFDLEPTPETRELETWLLAGETIRPDAARFFRSRPGAGRWQNPLAERDGQPGVVFRWLEVEGPLHDTWPSAGHRLLFGDLPLRAPARPGARVEVISAAPQEDARRLLAGFLARAYRRAVPSGEVERFLPVFDQALGGGGSFTDALVAAYTAVLCSPEFLGLAESPGELEGPALASRLALFLWNSVPDPALRALGESGRLREDAVLRSETERLLADPRAQRFRDAFLDYWLDLRKVGATSPDELLYPDYYLDDLLVESALAESRGYFQELLDRDLPVRHVVDADFAVLNEKLAEHYGLPAVPGVALRRVALPPGSMRGGFLTQAAVLKVTANGTTTSPVLRGAWVMERLLGRPPPPPPPGVPAVEPDIRGAATLRQQLEQHRAQASCAGCHARIDPAGFALEAFDVLGGARDRYRALGTPGTAPQPGLGRGGQKFAFHLALPVDATGEWMDGSRFADVREFKRVLLRDEDQLARNLAGQFVTYATGAPVRFSDRAEVEAMLARTRPGGHGVRALLHAVVQSRLFRHK
ncbi:MAG: DUF1588 domain-containing protein [Opitutaceae bacterium]